jgi:hypothetical protein
MLDRAPTTIARIAPVYFSIAGCVIRKCDLHFGGLKPHRANETGRPTGGKQLLRLGTLPGTTGAENLTSKVTTITAGDTTVPTARSTRLGGVPHPHAFLHDTSCCDGFLTICHRIFLRLPVKNRQGEVNENVIR